MSVIAKVMQVPEVLVTLDQEVLHIQVLAVPPMMDQEVPAMPVLAGIDIRVLVVLPMMDQAVLHILVLAVLPMTDPAVRVMPVLVETAGIAQQYVNDTALTQ
jgi:hypothetical protein